MVSRRDSFLAGLALAAVATATVALLGGELPDHATGPTPRMSYQESQRLKREMLPPGASMAEFELDHCRPLCLGGSNARANLQLQPWPEARVKDEDERFYCQAVGRGEMPREVAAGLLAKRWPCR